MELIKINPKEFGIEESKAKEISAQFKPMLDKMVELEDEYNKILKLSIDDVETSEKAKELRLKYVKVRTGTALIHKEQKSFYLQAGRFVDGWKNAQLFASQGKEQQLSEIENYQENLEIERIKKLNEERTSLISKYIEDFELINFGIMQNDVWDAYYSTKKKAHEDKIQAEKDAEIKHIAEQKRIEQERIAKEKKEREERERLKKENKRLEKEREEQIKKEEKERKKRKERELIEQKRAKELQPYIVFIRDYNKLISSTDEKYKLEFHDIKLGAEQQWEYDRKEQIKKHKSEQEREEKQRLDKIHRDKLESQLKAKKDTEEKLERERIVAENKAKKDAEKLAKAPIKKQMNIWINTLTVGSPPKLNDTVKDIIDKFEAFKDWAKIQIENI